MDARPDFTGASPLERPFTALLERLDDETLAFVRDKVGYGLDKVLLALCLFLVAFDTFMGNRTHPVFIAITFIEWYACALGSTLRAWWAPDDGKPAETAPLQRKDTALQNTDCIIADVELLLDRFRPDFVIWANNHGYDLDTVGCRSNLYACRSDGYETVAESFQVFLDDISSLPVPPEAWSASVYWYVPDDDVDDGPDLGASLFAHIAAGKVARVRVNRDGFDADGIAEGAPVPCAAESDPSLLGLRRYYVEYVVPFEIEAHDKDEAIRIAQGRLAGISPADADLMRVEEDDGIFEHGDEE